MNVNKNSKINNTITIDSINSGSKGAIMRKCIRSGAISDNIKIKISEIETNMLFIMDKKKTEDKQYLIKYTIEEIKEVLDKLSDIGTVGTRILKSNKNQKKDSFEEDAALIKNSILYFTELEKDLEIIDVEAKGIEYFRKEHNPSKNTIYLLKSFISNLFKGINNKINSLIFNGAAYLKLKEAKIKNKINDSSLNLERINKEINSMEEVLKPIEALKEESHTTKDHLKEIKNQLLKKENEQAVLKNKIKNKETSGFLSFIINNEDEMELSKLEDSITSLKESISSLEGKILINKNEIKLKINQLVEDFKKESYEDVVDVLEDLYSKQAYFLKRYNKNEVKLNIAKKTREEFKILGSEPTKIEDKQSNSSLDGMYISADEFRDVLKQSNGKMGYIKIENQPDIPCFTLPKKIDEDLYNALEGLGLFGDSTNKNYLMKKVEYNDQILLFPNDTDVMTSDLIKGNKFSLEYTETKDPCNGGTVILTCGSASVYEMHKREILFFLLEGINVTTANFSGYGESTGVQTEKSLNSNMEAIYQYLQSTHPTHNSRILLKSLCISGGPATYLAARLAQINLFLDKSPSEFRELVDQNIKSSLEKFKSKIENSRLKELSSLLLIEKNLDFLAYLVSTLISPNWKIKSEIKKVTGHTCILVAEEDELIKSNKDSNYDAAVDIQKKEKNKNRIVSSIKMPGFHNTPWFSTAEGRAGMKKFLKDAKLQGNFFGSKNPS